MATKRSLPLGGSTADEEDGRPRPRQVRGPVHRDATIRGGRVRSVRPAPVEETVRACERESGRRAAHRRGDPRDGPDTARRRHRTGAVRRGRCRRSGPPSRQPRYPGCWPDAPRRPAGQPTANSGTPRHRRLNPPRSDASSTPTAPAPYRWLSTVPTAGRTLPRGSPARRRRLRPRSPSPLEVDYLNAAGRASPSDR